MSVLFLRLKFITHLLHTGLLFLGANSAIQLIFVIYGCNLASLSGRQRRKTNLSLCFTDLSAEVKSLYKMHNQKS